MGACRRRSITIVASSRRFGLLLFTILIASVLLSMASAPPASAHGFSTTVYGDISAGHRAHQVRTVLDVEYDLFITSVADFEDDDPLFRAGMKAWDARDLPSQQRVVNDHRDSAVGYLTERFAVFGGSRACTPASVGDIVVHLRDVPYATVQLDWTCPEQRHDVRHVVSSSLFGDAEGYVRNAETIITYDLDDRRGSAVLDAKSPELVIQQSIGKRFWEFFRLGAEHLYTGIDHILFLLALIAGSRRLREVVLAATTFTLAHSVTFVLAALGVVRAPAVIIEPIIAFSIAVVAGWHLWRLITRREHANDIDTVRTGHLALDRPGWARLGVVFAFGLIHGLGFASALGIAEPFSWSLLSSLVVFNLGIEFVQLVIIAATFPALAVLRRRRPRIGLLLTGLIAGGVASTGLVWFVQRLL
ncbi:HupE/UreJ family protein [Microlunatus soli]|uniref:HupE / UreJ protein n=1 Tax=Microlunatus soli TaxID=630515 RepID=A0A1H1UQH3_9ACTN|nr:HupE/UreJ family protein [Microlunatus soli]SDS74814.1 HupE / UreJ protein [Microlunatus soli]